MCALGWVCVLAGWVLRVEAKNFASLARHSCSSCMAWWGTAVDCCIWLRRGSLSAGAFCLKHGSSLGPWGSCCTIGSHGVAAAFCCSSGWAISSWDVVLALCCTLG